MKKIKAIIYARLSREDEDKIDGKSESRSIENQIKMLTDYAKEKGFDIYKILYDDGYSGGTMNRPGFIELKQEIDAKSFQVLLETVLMNAQKNRIFRVIDKLYPVFQIRDFPLPNSRQAGITDAAGITAGHECPLSAKAQHLVQAKGNIQIDSAFLRAGGRNSPPIFSAVSGIDHHNRGRIRPRSKRRNRRRRYAPRKNTGKAQKKGCQYANSGQCALSKENDHAATPPVG